jgi:hypothetical protein
MLVVVPVGSPPKLQVVLQVVAVAAVVPLELP